MELPWEVPALVHEEPKKQDTKIIFLVLHGQNTVSEEKSMHIYFAKVLIIIGLNVLSVYSLHSWH